MSETPYTPMPPAAGLAPDGTASRGIRLAWIAALGALAIGTALTVQSLHLAKAYETRKARKRQEMQVLRALQTDLARGVEAVKIFAKLPARHPAPIAELMRDAPGGFRAEDIKPDARRDGPPGWSIRRKELVFSDAPIGSVLEFVAKAEAGRPPWCLTKISLHASSRAAGFARIEMILEAADAKE